MASPALPEFIVINVRKAGTNTYDYRKDDGSVADEEESMFSPLVKIEVERATKGDNCVHLRFCHNNKYWQKKAASDSIVAISNKQEEDTTKPTCTLFEPTLTLQADLYFTHVQTGWEVPATTTCSLDPTILTMACPATRSSSCAAVSSMTSEARLQVQELVMDRKIIDVRYRMEDARIYGETPYLAGTTHADNYADGEDLISVELGYDDTRSYSFSRS